MKRLSLLVTLLVTILHAHLHAATFTAGQITITPGQTTQLAIGMNNSETNLSGFQFKLYLPEGLSVATNDKGKFVYTQSARIENHTITIKTLNDGGYLVVGYSMDADVITGTSGELMSISITADETASSSGTGTLSNIRVTDVSSTTTSSASVSFAVTVNIPATGISLNNTMLSFTVIGETTTLVATVTPDNATNKNVTWTSSNTAVASVSSNGVVTSVANGTATITATTADGSSKSATCTVTVSISSPIISFTDTNVKALCVENWDSNEDGELSEAEAAAVTDLGEVFKNNTEITSFDELQYFTGLTTIGNNAFDGCSSLTSIAIPSSLKWVKTESFRLCTSLSKVIVPDIAAWCGIIYEGIDAWAPLGNFPLGYAQHLYSDENTEITELVIPEGVTRIEPMAFRDAKYITSVTIPNSVTFIGEQAFAGMHRLSSIIIPQNVTTIEPFTFWDCQNLTSVTIPEGVITIGDNAFRDCTSLESVSLPESLKHLWGHSFLGCSALPSITIPDGITHLDKVAFQECSNLTTFTYNKAENELTKVDGVYQIGTAEDLCNFAILSTAANADICAQLTSDIDYTGYIITGYSLNNQFQHIGLNGYCGTFDGNGHTITVDINNPDSWAVAALFRELGKGGVIKNLRVAGHVESVSKFSAGIVSNLKSGKVSHCVSDVDIISHIDGDCTDGGIAGIATYDGEESIVEYCVVAGSFQGSNAHHRGGIIGIGYGGNSDNITIDNCLFLANVDGLDVTESGTFIRQPTDKTTINNCYYLNVLGTVTSGTQTTTAQMTSGELCFLLNGNQSNINWTQNLTGTDADTYPLPFSTHAQVYAYDNTYSNNDLSPNITFTDSNVKAICVSATTNWDTNHDGELSEAEAAVVTDLGEVFKNNTEITSFDELQYFTGLTSIGAEAFYRCSSLTSVVIPDNITQIGYSAFDDCFALTSVNLPATITFIDGAAFSDCRSLTSITLPEGIPSIGDWFFDNCTGLTEIVIPSSVTAIGQYAFEGCLNLQSVTLPEGLTSIGNGAFMNCNAFTSIVIPSSVTSIGVSAFAQCSNVTSVVVEQENSTYDSRENCNAIIEKSTNKLIAGCKNTVIPEGVTTIGETAFYSTKLTSITIPSSVTSIGHGAFSGCSGLTSVTVCNPTPVSIDEETFTNRANAVLFVPAGCKETYQAADYWKEFKLIADVSDDILLSGEILPWEMKYVFRESCEDLQEPEADSNENPWYAAEYDDSAWETLTGPMARDAERFSQVNYPWETPGSCYFLRRKFQMDAVREGFYEIHGICDDNMDVYLNGHKIFKTGLEGFNWSFRVPSLFLHEGENTLAIFAADDGGGEAYLDYSMHFLQEDEIIEFADPDVEEICCNSYWFDSNGDGHLSKVEAASVESLMDSFMAHEESVLETFDSFDELQYFTGLTELNAWVFLNCRNLSSIIIPESVKSISSWAFQNCSSLTSITIPESVTSIESDAFLGCSGLTSVTFLGNALGDRQHFVNIFSGCPDDILFNIPEGTAGSYLRRGFKNLSDKSGLPLVREVFEAEATRISAMAEEVSDGDKTALASAIEEARVVVANTDDYMAVYAQIAAVKSAAKTFLTTATLPQDFDVTAATITNPDFDLLDIGWKVDNIAENIGRLDEEGINHWENGDVVMDNFIEAYQTGRALGEGSISQTITKLPAGTYRFEADIIASNEYDASAEVTGVCLFAGENMSSSVSTEFRKPQHISFTFENPTTCDVTVGINITGTNANWVAADNFRLYYVVQEEVEVTDISSAEELIAFAARVNEGHTNINANLTADIDLDGYAYTAIGTEENPFCGTFDGQGHVISNLTIDTDNNNQGLVGAASGGAVVRNVTLDNTCSISGGSYVAGIVGIAYNTGTLTIENCGNEASVDAAGMNAAGILGCAWAQATTVVITNCYNAGTVSAAGESAGISGWLGSNATVTNCYNIGQVTGLDEDNTFARYESDATFQNCYETIGSQVTPIVSDQVTSGELCWMLNGESSENPNWFQTLGEDNHPVPFNTHETVYKQEGIYTNTPLENTLYAADVSVCRGGKDDLPIILKNTENVRMFQFVLTLPEGLSIASENGELQAVLTDRAGTGHSLSCTRKDNGDYLFMVSQTNLEFFSGNSGDAVVKVKLAIPKDFALGDYQISMKDVELTLYRDGTNIPITPANSNSILTVNPKRRGDANGSGTVTVTDISVTVDIILEEGYDEGADANGNGKVTVTDIADIVDIILATPVSSRKTNNKLDPQ